MEHLHNQSAQPGTVRNQCSLFDRAVRGSCHLTKLCFLYAFMTHSGANSFPRNVSSVPDVTEYNSLRHEAGNTTQPFQSKMMKLRDGEYTLPDLPTLPPDGGPDFNRLVFTSSPYLLQHARNPVDWYPWCDEAFEKARSEDKPVFLSVGYSTCHWCHVMEHESFEDPDIAAYLNEHFVSVKVDREERPDVDHIYMSVCQAMTGSGGWPMTIFMTPEKMPFYAGTYFPRTDRSGRPGFLRVLTTLQQVWTRERHKALETAEEIRLHLAQAETGTGRALTADTLERAVLQGMQSYDAHHGGFGNAPKFPMPHLLSLFLRQSERVSDGELLAMVEHTLISMYQGGLFDHVGFGFCRYATDNRWLVPHFEKMLYDNALLLMAYTDAYQRTGKPLYERIAREIIAYVRRDLTDPRGGFYSAENADSEGEEGKFYVFTHEEFLGIVGEPHGAMMAEYFGVTPAGNFEQGTNILHVAVDREEWKRRHGVTEAEASAIIQSSRRTLFDARAARVHPSLDDKILTSWNGLMIAALARAGQALGDETIIELAIRAADFILDELCTEQGLLLHRYRKGVAGIEGFLEDYAFLVWGLIDLYEATFDARFLGQAVELNAVMLRDFRDSSQAGLYFTSHDAEELISRPKDVYDGAIPSGNSAAACNLLRLSRMTGDTTLDDRAQEILAAFATQVERYPTGHSMMLTALDFSIGPTQEIVVAGDAPRDAEALIRHIRERFLPRKVLLFHPSGSDGAEIRSISSYIHSNVTVDSRPAVYICESFQCALPVTTVEQLDKQLSSREPS